MTEKIRGKMARTKFCPIRFRRLWFHCKRMLLSFTTLKRHVFLLNFIAECCENDTFHTRLILHSWYFCGGVKH